MISNRTYGIDPDVIAYNARIVSAGNQGLNPVGMRQVNQFVIGLKKLKLWDLAPNIFLLSSHQNAGAGNIVYGLKTGQDGVFTITPDGTKKLEWSTNGINFYGPTNSGGNPYIKFAPFQVYRGNVTFFSIGKGNGQNQAIYFAAQSDQSDSQRAIRIWPDAAFSSTEITYGSAQDASANAQIKAGLFNSISYTAFYDSTTGNGYIKVYKNGILVTTTSNAPMTLPIFDGGNIYPAPSEFRIGHHFYRNDAKIHFFGAFYKTLSDQEHKDLNDLIKKTIGEGLNLL